MASNGDKAPGMKRKHEDVESELARRVSQRTKVENWKESMEKILQHDLSSDDTDVVEKAMKDLALMLCHEDDDVMLERQRHFLPLSGHTAVVGVMKAHPNLEVLQRYSISAIVNATYGNEEARDKFTAVGGFEAILAAMKKYHSNDDIQTDCTGVLYNFLFFHEANVDLFVAEHDGIPFLLQQMENFPSNVELIENVCWALQVISSYDKFRKSLVDFHVVSILARAFDHYDDNRTIREWTRMALHNMTKSDK